MSLIEQAKVAANEGAKPAEKVIEKKIGPYTRRWTEAQFVEEMTALEQSLYKGMVVNFAPGAARAISHDVRDGYVPGLFLNHQSHYDGRAAGKAISAILPVVNDALPHDSEPYRGFVAPIATSIGSGDQDSTLQRFFHRMSRLINQDGFYTLDFTREKDEVKYGMERGRQLQTEFTQKMVDQMNQGLMPAIFPEATVEGGRSKKDESGQPIKGGGVNGMQPFDKSAMRRMSRIVEGTGKTPSFIPVGISGTYKIFSPDTLKPQTSAAIRAKIPFWPTGIVRVTIGEPIRWDDMTAMIESSGSPVNDQTINKFMGSHLSNLLPPKERGVFAGSK